MIILLERLILVKFVFSPTGHIQCITNVISIEQRLKQINPPSVISLYLFQYAAMVNQTTLLIKIKK